jgi:hypothetical protein
MRMWPQGAAVGLVGTRVGAHNELVCAFVVRCSMRMWPQGAAAGPVGERVSAHNVLACACAYVYMCMHVHVCVFVCLWCVAI